MALDQFHQYQKRMSNRCLVEQYTRQQSKQSIFQFVRIKIIVLNSRVSICQSVYRVDWTGTAENNQAHRKVEICDRLCLENIRHIKREKQREQRSKFTSDRMICVPVTFENIIAWNIKREKKGANLFLTIYIYI